MAARKPPSELTTPQGARLSCGCDVKFRPGSDGSPFLVVIDRKGEACVIATHVAGLPQYDRRAALRPPTRLGPLLQPDYEDG